MFITKSSTPPNQTKGPGDFRILSVLGRDQSLSFLVHHIKSCKVSESIKCVPAAPCTAAGGAGSMSNRPSTRQLQRWIASHATSPQIMECPAAVPLGSPGSPTAVQILSIADNRKAPLPLPPYITPEKSDCSVKCSGICRPYTI